jgi:hypothetical protein
MAVAESRMDEETRARIGEDGGWAAVLICARIGLYTISFELAFSFVFNAVAILNDVHIYLRFERVEIDTT